MLGFLTWILSHTLEQKTGWRLGNQWLLLTSDFYFKMLFLGDIMNKPNILKDTVAIIAIVM